MPNTVMLWGNRWWLPHRSSPVVFADLSAAADALAAAWSGDDRTIRLVFQPNALESTLVSCPHGNRATLTLALAEQHPALGDPRRAWSHEPILPAGDGFTTLLHYETEPGLFDLIARLQERGFILTAVWPMVTWLNALPTDLAESGSTTIAAIADDRVCLYCDSIDGSRGAFIWNDPQRLQRLEAFIKQRVETDRGSRVLLVIADETILPSIASLPCSDRVQILALVDALHSLASLPVRHPAQLLAVPARWTAPRVMVAASVALLLASTALGARLAYDYSVMRADATALQRQTQALRTEVARLGANAAEIADLRATLATAQPTPPVTAFARKLSATIPSEIVLRSLRLTPESFTGTGWISPRASPATGQGWTARLGAKPWQLSGPFEADSTGAFRLTGSWR